MKILSYLLFSFFSLSVPILESVDVEDIHQEETFITKETPVFFDLQMLGIPHDILNQNVTTDDYEIIAMFLYEDLVFVYLWLGQWKIPTITHFDQLVLNAVSMNNTSLSVFEIGNSLNGLLDVVKYCDILQVSVLSLNLTRNLLNYDRDWSFQVTSLRFQDRNFISMGQDPFVVNFSFGNDYIDFEIEEIRVLLTRYSVHRVNFSRGNVPNFQVGLQPHMTVDLHFWNFDFPLPIDNIHSATFNFTVERYERNRWGGIVFLPWSSWNRNVNRQIVRQGVVVEPNTFSHSLIPSGTSFELITTGVERQRELGIGVVPNFHTYDFSIMIWWSIYEQGSTHQSRLIFDNTEMIEVLFETNGRMFRSEIELENGPVGSEDVYDHVVPSPMRLLPFAFVVGLWLVIALLIPFVPFSLRPAIWGVGVLSWFIHI